MFIDRNMTHAENVTDCKQLHLQAFSLGLDNYGKNQKKKKNPITLNLKYKLKHFILNIQMITNLMTVLGTF